MHHIDEKYVVLMTCSEKWWNSLTDNIFRHFCVARFIFWNLSEFWVLVTFLFRIGILFVGNSFNKEQRTNKCSSLDSLFWFMYGPYMRKFFFSIFCVSYTISIRNLMLAKCSFGTFVWEWSRKILLFKEIENFIYRLSNLEKKFKCSKSVDFYYLKLITLQKFQVFLSWAAKSER